MSTSLSSLRTITRQQYRFDPNGRVFSNDELDNYLEQAYKHVQEELGFLLDKTQVISTVAGTQEYTLNDLVRIKDDGVMIGTTVLGQTEEQETSGRTEQAKPTRWYTKLTDTGMSIGFIDIPDATYSVNIFYKGYRPALSDSQPTTLAEIFDLPIALYASYLAEYTLRGNTQNAINKLQAYNNEKLRVGGRRYSKQTTFYTKR